MIQHDEGVSEVVAAILLIGLVVLGIGIVSVLLVSTPPPAEIPKTNIQIINNSEDSVHIYFYNAGGDPLPRKLTEFMAEGEPVTDTIEIGFPDDSGEVTYHDWDDNSDILWNYSSVVRISQTPKSSYQIRYLGGGGDYLLKEFGVGSASSSGRESPVTCGEIPNAEFNINQLSDFLYSFTAQDDSSTTYHDWSVIGTGKTSNDADFSYTFPVPESGKKVYPIQHIAYNITDGSQSCTRSTTQYVSVECSDEKCSVDFEYENDYFTITDPDPDNSNLTECKWDFGDGTNSTEKHPKKVTFVDGEDEHLVTLSIKWDRCGQEFSCSITKKVAVDTKCGCFSAYSDESSYVSGNYTVKFTWYPPQTTNSQCNGISSSTDWLITFDWGDGDTQTFYKNEELGTPIWSTTYPHTYSSCGEYSVKMSVMDLTKGKEYYSCVRTVSIPCLCDYPPVADFSVDFDRNTLDAVITDNSRAASVENRKIAKWEFDFGDGTSVQSFTSKPSSFTHTYSDCGTFVITLTVFDSIGCWTSTTRTISCGDDSNCDPDDTIASFTVSSDSDNPKRFKLTDESYSINNTLERWEWDFGDGNSAINTSAPSSFWIEYDDCGSYPVTLRVWDDIGCWDDMIREVTCSCPSPTAKFRIEESSSDPTKFIFTDESTYDSSAPITSWLWDFGDGDSSTSQNPTHLYKTCGQYTVRLTVTTDCGSTDDYIRDAVCGCPAPTPEFEYSCTGEKKVNFTDVSHAIGGEISGWYWNFGDYGDYNTSILQNPVHEYDEPGTYSVSLTVTTDCGSSASWTRNVTVPCCVIPIPDFTYTCLEDGYTVQFNDTSTTYGETITSWNWDFGGAGTGTVSNPKFRFPSSGSYPVNLTITTECGASNSYIHNITLPCICSPPVADFTQEVISRDPFTIRYVDSSDPNTGTITFWNWSFGDGTYYSGQNPPDKVYETCGEYLVNLRVVKDCGTYDDLDSLICCPVYADFSYAMNPSDGYAPVTVTFTDQTEGEPNAWEWNFGDGSTSYQQNPVHKYTNGGNYTVNLHATSSCGGNETHSEILTIKCPEVTADFSYTIITDDPFNVSFVDQSTSDAEIVEWTWFFGDGTTSVEKNPYHQYAGKANYNVNLIVKNSCGNVAQTWRRISYECPNLTADFIRTPESGVSPLEVQFTDNSSELDDIVSWLWFFGDGSSYYTTDSSSRNPPNHTYTNLGSYYVTLQIKNECGNPFSVIKMVNVTDSANIAGYLWNDRNMNQVKDSDESWLENWEVTLQERISGSWTDRESTNTDENGDYVFSLDDVTYGAFRVKETLQPRWNATYSYPSGDESIYSGTLLISSSRNYVDVNFGNVRTNTSKFEFPGYFYYWNEDRNRYDTFSMNETPKYWDFNTSFNWDGQKIYYPNPYVITYTAQGDSSFDVTIGFYARYLIHIQWNNDPPIEYTHWLKYWMYDGDRTDGFTFYVPDNSVITKPNLYFDIDNVRWFELYIPYEGATIPYSTSSYVEAHMTGTGGSTTGCTLIAPVTKQLTWSRSWGYFTGTWDNTPYEGQTITITAHNDFGPVGNPRFISSSKNVFVDWEPVTPIITSPTNNTLVQGTITVTGTVGGHNRDTDNVWLLVDGEEVGQMTYDSLNNIFTYSLNVESYAGKTIEVTIRAYPLTGQGSSQDSTPVYLRAQSTQSILANFTADPWTGPAPLEVSFTDTSTGGPASWLWNFNDGYFSTEQNPIHIFEDEGNYLVSLTVENIDGEPSTVSHYVNTTGLLRSVNLLTNRNGHLHSGYASWIVQGSGSTITIGGTEYSLSSGDQVRLDVGVSQSTAEIRMTGEITAFNVSDVSLTVNDVLIDSGDCTAIHIYDFNNYHSDLKLTVYRQSNSWLNLIWDGSQVSVESYQYLEISDIMPSSDKIMEFILESGNIYLNSRASSYRLYS